MTSPCLPGHQGSSEATVSIIRVEANPPAGDQHVAPLVYHCASLGHRRPNAGTEEAQRQAVSAANAR